MRQIAPVVAILSVVIVFAFAFQSKSRAAEAREQLQVEANRRAWAATRDSLVRTYAASELAAIPDSTFRRVHDLILYLYGGHDDSVSMAWLEEVRPHLAEVNERVNTALREQRIADAIASAPCDRPNRAKVGEGMSKGWNPTTSGVVACGRVQIGMTAEQARASWGAPRDVNRTTTAYGVHEQWVYSGSYLYFEDGILRTIQN